MNNTYADNLENVVSYAPQNYPESAKAQARKNIGIDTLGGGNGVIDFDLSQAVVEIPLTSGQTAITYTLPYDAYVQISTRNNLSLVLDLNFNGNWQAVIALYNTHSGYGEMMGISLKGGTEIRIRNSGGLTPSHQNAYIFKLK